MIRMAILQCDSVRPELQAAHGDYPAMFESLLSAAARERALPLTVDTFDARVGHRPDHPADYDAYLITGSRHSVYDDEVWIRGLAAFVGQTIGIAAQCDRPSRAPREPLAKVVGICFGHQLIAHFFGGLTAESDKGWGVGVQRFDVLETVTWMAPRLEGLSMLTSYRDQVMRLPHGARRIAGSEFCENAGYVIGDTVMALQGHPEFSRAYARALMSHRRDAIGDAALDAAIETLTDATDELAVAQWILNFVQPAA